MCSLHIAGTKICVIGLWHLGCVYAACLAELGYSVIGADENVQVVSNLRIGKAPLFEPGLDDLVSKGIAAGKLSFITDISAAAAIADFVVLAYDTPIDEHDRVNLSIVFHAVYLLKSNLHTTLVVSSQVPVGTCDEIEKQLDSAGVAYVPENLRLGQAIERFMNPDMIVIGANNAVVATKVKKLFAPIRSKIIEMDLRSAEMTKHALNSFLATSISFANEIGNICDLVGADGLKVAAALRSDSRIGSKALVRPGLGFAGGTLARDLRSLQETARKHGFSSTLIDAVLDVNEKQNYSVINRLRRVMGVFTGKTITIFGLTYKPGTDTLRRSAALEIIKQLEKENAVVKAYDPRVQGLVGNTIAVNLFQDPYCACEGSDALVILNELPEFTNMDFKKIGRIMRTAFVLDTQNLLDSSKMIDSGIKYVGLGRGMAV